MSFSNRDPKVVTAGYAPTEVIRTSEQAMELMYDRYPEISAISIPREIIERSDLCASDKIVFGVLCALPPRRIHRVFEIAGMANISVHQVDNAILRLARKNLIVIKHKRSTGYCKCIAYRIIKRPSRFDGEQHLPKFMSNDISDFEELVRTFFDVEKTEKEYNKRHPEQE